MVRSLRELEWREEPKEEKGGVRYGGEGESREPTGCEKRREKGTVRVNKASAP